MTIFSAKRDQGFVSAGGAGVSLGLAASSCGSSLAGAAAGAASAGASGFAIAASGLASLGARGLIRLRRGAWSRPRPGNCAGARNPGKTQAGRKTRRHARREPYAGRETGGLRLLFRRHVLQIPAEDLGLLARQAEFEIGGLRRDRLRLVGLAVGRRRLRGHLDPAVGKIADIGEGHPHAVGVGDDAAGVGGGRGGTLAHVLEAEGVEQRGEAATP